MIRLLLLSFLLPCCAFAGDSLTVRKVLPMNARSITIDDLGNVYVVKNNNYLVRYNSEGDSTAFYNSISNGDIGMVDATNPLRVLVYYPMYSKVVVLDRMLAFKNELDLPKARILKPAAVASGADGTLWVYDRFNARIRKIDDELTERSQSNDLRQELGIVPEPVFMTERDRRLFLCDTMRGIFIFDRYGNYINTISVFGVTTLQVFNQQLVYRKGDTLQSYDLMQGNVKNIMLPASDVKLLQAAILRDQLSVLYADRLVLYKIKEGN